MWNSRLGRMGERNTVGFQEVLSTHALEIWGQDVELRLVSKVFMFFSRNVKLFD